MENKEIRENVTLDTFSILSNAGWIMVIMRIANTISTPWHAILAFWLALFGIALVLGIVTAIIGLWTNKGGGHKVD
ncbi:hypothetical protein [Lacticaseibacillus paracasei]|uniref:hypothetical protein n=1 Tax=Lacticaseibacillus paracasei TaxID=1597 RepID=UPI0008DC9F6C|nr:hypothetical protein [Lacticaseibacillus paracasei]OHY44414.1 hypothetical protein BBX46_14650 [Lacticaseibacillus paracasei]QPC20666.1 hypothetical protein LacP0625_08370 [Lacticaseibacillus paracasei subsp. tolerans]